MNDIQNNNQNQNIQNNINSLIENSIINNITMYFTSGNNISRLLSRRYYNDPPTGGYIVNEEEEYELYSIENDDIASLVFLDTLEEINSISYKEMLKSIGKYKKVKENNKELLNSECSICIDSFKPNEYYRKLGCNHYFHKRCIDRWIKKDKNECPMCRQIIINNN